MPRQSRISLRDMRRGFELLDEVRQQSASHPEQWRRQLGLGLSDLIGAEVVVSCAVPSTSVHHRLLLRDPVDLGYPTAMARSVFAQWADRSDFTTDPTMAAIEQAVLKGRRVTASRGQIQDDRHWYNLFHYNEIRRNTHMDDFIRSYRPLAGNTHFGTWFSFAREKGRSPFTPRDRQLVCLVHNELNRILTKLENSHSSSGKSIGYSSDDEPLPPRLQQTADLLKQGLSVKQIAYKTGATLYAVLAHIKRLHQRYEVNSRAELIIKLMNSKPAVPPSSIFLTIASVWSNGLLSQDCCD